VAPYTIQDGGGAPRRPAIQVSYDGDLDYVQNVRCQVRLDAGDLLQFDGTSPYGDPATNDPTESVIISYSSILPNTDYEARGQYVRANGTSSDWSDWLAVTTPNVLYGDADVYLPGLVDEINQATADQLAPLNVNIRDLITDARRVAREASNQDAGQYLDHQSSLTQVKSVYQQITADYQFVITAATGPTSAIVQRLETLEATIPGLATVSAVNIVQLNVDSLGATVTAQGTSIAGLNATVGNFSASSLFRTAVVATEAGALATVGISVAATAGGATSQAALLLSALAGGDSMLGLVASKVYITDGTNKFNPFVFTSGVAYLENIVVGTLKFNQLSSNNSKLVIRGSGSLADISVFV
ncbi:hypothetical protein LB579_31095, partial [Mesorhizobium sp. BR1-1-7]|nr:hypothetical protein [Mesorhizobium sp. BR1-1-7]